MAYVPPHLRSSAAAAIATLPSPKPPTGTLNPPSRDPAPRRSTPVSQPLDPVFEPWKPSDRVSRLLPEQIDQVRAHLNVDVTSPSGSPPAPPPIESFTDMCLNASIMKDIASHEYTRPTPIQAQAMPVALSGRDLLGCAETGSGKTAAFAIPMIQHCLAQSPIRRGDGPLALVLAPTRELAQQIEKEVKAFSQSSGSLRTAVVVGGTNISETRAQLPPSSSAMATTALRFPYVHPRASHGTSLRAPSLLPFHLPTTASRLRRIPRIILTAVAQEEAFAATAAAEDASLEEEVGVVGDKAAEVDEGVGGGAEAAGSPHTKLYFGNLPYNCDSSQLAGIIQEYADPEMIEVLYDKESGRSRGFAFVTMNNIADCDAVIKNLDGSEYGGRVLRVNYSDKPRNREPLYPETNHKLFVGNLSWTVTSESLQAFFAQYGNVVGARVIYDGDTGKSRGYGFVCYATREEMDEALESLDGSELEGRAIRISVAMGRRS